jgi:hypothetical protein
MVRYIASGEQAPRSLAYLCSGQATDVGRIYLSIFSYLLYKVQVP